MRRFASQRLASSLPGVATCIAAARDKSSTTSESVINKIVHGASVSELPVKPAAAAPPRRVKKQSGAAKATSAETNKTGEELMASIFATLSSRGPVDQKPPQATSDVKSVATSTPKPKSKPAAANVPQRKSKKAKSLPANPERPPVKPRLAAKAKRPATPSSTSNARLAKSQSAAKSTTALDVPVSDPPVPPAPSQPQQQQQPQEVATQPSDPIVARDEPVRVLVLVPGFLVLELARQPPPGVSAPFGRVVLASLDTCSSDSANRLKIGDPARCDLIVNPIHKHFAGANHLMAVNVRL
jgi:hypothetical protein